MITDPLPTNPLFALLATVGPPSFRGAIMVLAAMVMAIMGVCGKNYEKLIVHDVGPHPSP